MGAYSASKAAVEALGNTLRQEVRPSGARVGVAYFAELDTDMTSRGFGTEAARQFLGDRTITTVTPLDVGIDALERGIARRSRIIVAPSWVRPILPVRMVAQRVVDQAVRRRVADVRAHRPRREGRAHHSPAGARLVSTEPTVARIAPGSRAGRRAPGATPSARCRAGCRAPDRPTSS